MNDPKNNRNELKEVLYRIVLRKIRKLHESAERTGGNFNFFSFLSMERNEVKHSAIIAELLNPNGSHSQRTLFLKLFLKQLQATIQNSSSESSGRLRSFLERLKPTIDASNELTGFIVRTEKYVPELKEQEKGFLDIVIESDDAYIVIENKIDTVDAEGQLEKYCKHIETIEKQTKVLLYLTPKGKKPETKELTLCGKRPVYKLKEFPFPLMCLSYKGFIAKWLDNCITTVSGPPRILETLHQYQMTVRRLTGQLPPEVEDILNKDILGENYEELKGKIIERVQHELQYDFWKELKKRLIEEQLTDQNSKFQLYKSDMEVTEISEDDLEEYISDNFLGLTFGIPNGLLDDGKHEVAFRVYYERPHGRTKLSSFNYGFVFCRKRNTEKDTLQRDRIKQQHKDEDAIKRYMRLEHPHKKDKPSHGQDGWLSWDYFYYKPRNFITESKETLIRRLTSEINLALSKAR